ncbi:MAG: N-acetylgalactosamine-6-sulfatase, partial [Planctomycetota bacterium]
HYPHAPHRSDYFTVYRNGNWKVIYHYFPSKASEDSHYQLYNLADDPFEATNLALSKPDQLRRMMLGLIAEQKKHNTQHPVDKAGSTTPLKPELP